MNKWVVIFGAVVVIPLLFFLAMGFKSDPRLIESPLLGQEAPDFQLADLDGNIYSLADLKGKPVMINFWATWCQPCIAEHPVLVDAAQRWRGKAHFLGVIYNDDEEKIRKFVRQRGAWGPALVDPDVAVAIAYGVYGAPETFFIDPQGIVVEKVVGAMYPRQIDALLQGML